MFCKGRETAALIRSFPWKAMLETSRPPLLGPRKPHPCLPKRQYQRPMSSAFYQKSLYIVPSRISKGRECTSRWRTEQWQGLHFFSSFRKKPLDTASKVRLETISQRHRARSRLSIGCCLVGVLPVSIDSAVVADLCATPHNTDLLIAIGFWVIWTVLRIISDRSTSLGRRTIPLFLNCQEVCI
jgi:hypothetical protein